MSDSVTHVPGSTRKICQLTGEFDRELQQPTANRTESRFKLAGTDLGASFSHDGRIYFLFGDSHPTQMPNAQRPANGNSIAHTTDAEPESGLDLTFVSAPDGGYSSPTLPGVSLSSFEVPSGGFSLNNTMYVFFTTDHTRDMNGDELMGRSVLARSQDSGQTFAQVHELSRLSEGGKFINVSPWVVEDLSVLGAGSSGPGLLLWGSGRYRTSSPYLAYIELSDIEAQTVQSEGTSNPLARILRPSKRKRLVNPSYRFFSGTDPETHKPHFSASEADATPLFVHPYIGELSVSWNPFLRRWLMLYNCLEPRGIVLRSAVYPWGPWSGASVIFDPVQDGGYCHFMHRAWEADPATRCDSVHDPGREAEWGGEYGPYVIAPYTTGDESESTIYYVMSTWNPYNIVLMKSTLVLG
jgi:hypothetical protein